MVVTHRYTLLSILVSVVLVCMPFPTLPVHSELGIGLSSSEHSGASITSAAYEPDPLTGILDPVTVEHVGVPSGPTIYATGRTDTTETPTGEAWLPAGAVGNLRSAACDGGYFLVGAGGSTSFASPAGTISLWIKWDGSATNGRFWGQDGNFETRWSSGRLVLDWGGDGNLQGTKSDWIAGHWYFLAITWNETFHRLSIYWGDENTLPTHDASSITWSSTVLGLLTQNNIMNSAGRTTAQVAGHVDDFRYYDVERELEDIQGDYTLVQTGTEPGLVHYYEFEDDLTDSSGAGDLVSSGGFEFSRDVFSGDSSWVASQVALNVRNLKMLYALNGTFDNGIAGANVDWTGDGQYHPYGWRARRTAPTWEGRQRASYSQTGDPCITIENEGYEVTSPDGFRHYDGTVIYWYQFIDNSKLCEDFIFNMDYLYLHGPLGVNYAGNFEFRVEILNGTSVLWDWSLDPTNLTERSQWFSAGSVPVTILNAPSTMEMRVVLEVSTAGSYVQILDGDPDLDGDSVNGQYISFMIDDISLVGAEVPDFRNVSFRASNPQAGATDVVGLAGLGHAILNYSYWNLVTIPVAVSCNDTVSFEFSCEVTQMHRFMNSSASTGPGSEGVAFSVTINEQSEMSLLTYIQSSPEATDLSLVVYHPSDWDPSFVLDPFDDDVTGSCVTYPGRIQIPAGLVDSAGWWHFLFTAPNYVEEIQTEVWSHTGGVWEAESLFRSNQRIRTVAVLGTGAEYVSDLDNVEIRTYDSSGTPWVTEVLDAVNSSSICGSATTLGPVNASVGLWTTTVAWSNGTEVAFGSRTFEMHHDTTIFAHTPDVQVEIGQEFTAAIHVYDKDNGNAILSGADIEGNFSSGNVIFSPNLAQGWWEATFNTSGLVSGTYVIQVDVTITYYETQACFINLRIPEAESGYAVAFRAGVLGAMFLFLGFLGVTYGRRLYMSVAAKRNLELLVMKARLEDAKNLIGLLVIQRIVGLSVYSKILKGAFEESILSSFISAISHFRSEFSMTEPKWKAIPITEAITAVQTEQLICALITVDPASTRIRDHLEEFGRAIGTLYDNNEEVTKPKALTSAHTSSVAKVLEPLFDSYFDGALLVKYVGVRKTLPSHLRPVAEALSGADMNYGVLPESLIRSLVMSGYSERRAYRLVLEAVDGGHLIRSEGALPPPEAPPFDGTE
jgi:hypothetical protein